MVDDIIDTLSEGSMKCPLCTNPIEVSYMGKVRNNPDSDAKVVRHKLRHVCSVLRDPSHPDEDAILACYAEVPEDTSSEHIQLNLNVFKHSMVKFINDEHSKNSEA